MSASATAEPAPANRVLRNVGWLIVQRAPQLVASVGIAALVPRTMGPEIYGRYTLLTSLSMWFLLASGLGLSQAIVRNLPHLRAEPDAQRAFVGRLVGLRLGAGLATGGLYLLATHWWLQEIDPVVLALIGATVAVRTLAHLSFELCLGLNLAARWGWSQVLRSYIALGLVLAGFLWRGLAGAALGLLFTEGLMLAIGIYWVRRAGVWAPPRLDVARAWPLVRLGLAFYAGELVLAAFRRSGEAMVRLLSHDYAQVAYFGLAYDIYLTAAMWLPQITLALGPHLTLLLAREGSVVVRAWIERLLRLLATLCVFVLLGALFLGRDLLPLVIGPGYEPVAGNLLLLCASLALIALANTECLIALLLDRPAPTVVYAAIKLATFWALGPWLVLRWGARGGCVAVLAANLLSVAWLAWRMQRLWPHPLRTYLTTLALGAPPVLLVFISVHGLLARIGLWLAALALYALELGALRIIRLDELRALAAALAGGAAPNAGSLEEA